MALQLKTPEPVRHARPLVKARNLAYLLFERPDLERAERFLNDFGLRTVSRNAKDLYLRGTGDSPYCYRVTQGQQARFVGFGLALDSRDDLVLLSRQKGVGPVMRSEAPGGGEFVVLTDPSGFRVEAVWGRQAWGALPHRAPLAFNQAGQTPRVDGFQRPPVAPPEVLKLGHIVIEVADFQATAGWYTSTFGFIPSDVQVLPDGSPGVAFMRLDLGDEPADHHTLAIAQGFMPTYSHSAFEVVDVDAVGMGQRLLRERGWKHAWGVGRHILGSQIFDYWEDPWGAKHEHYCDGDVLTAGLRTGVHPVSRDAMAQWGPQMPASFTRPQWSPAAVVALVRNLWRSPDLTLRKLITLAGLFA